MGGGRFESTAYSTYSNTRTLRTDGTRMHHSEIFTKTKVDNKFDPSKITIRESVDSPTSPHSRAFIVALDVTGSMGMIPGEMANNQLGRLMEMLVSTQVVEDPHLMFMAVGDIEWDRAPLQATQFEADIRIAEQLSDLYLEGGGGNNNYESYHLPWLFAAKKTKIDCWDKRRQKGILFTIGDEMPPTSLSGPQVKKILGSGQHDLTTEELLAEVKERYEVFHLIVEEGSYYRRNGFRVRQAWHKLMNNRAMLLSDYTKISDVIVAATAVSEGRDPEEVISEIQGDKTQEVVRHALYGMTEAAKQF